jgi:hypothetical protein
MGNELRLAAPLDISILLPGGRSKGGPAKVKPEAA